METNKDLNNLLFKIDCLKTPRSWLETGATATHNKSRARAKNVTGYLSAFYKILPVGAAVIVEGGILLTYHGKDKYLLFNIGNDLSIIGTIFDGKKDEVLHLVTVKGFDFEKIMEFYFKG